MQIDFAKDRYDYELKRSDQLTAALTLPVGVLSVLGGLMVAMARSFAVKTLWLLVPFGVAFGADVFAFFLCLVEEAFREFNSYVERTGGDVDATFSDHLCERIIDAADRNTINNEHRSGLLHRARVALFAVLICTTAAGVVYVVNQMVR